jgi:hypothetical protein
VLGGAPRDLRAPRAVAHDAAQIEGWPWDTAGIKSTHRGHSGVFAAEGFVPEGARRVRRLGPGRG